MKVAKRFPQVVIICLIAALAVAGVLYAIKPTILPQLSYFNWLATLLAIVIMLSPWGSIKLLNKQSDRQKTTARYFFIKVVLLEISLLLIYYGISQLLGSTIIKHNPNPSNHFSSELANNLSQYGLFPFATMAIFAISFGVNSYLKNNDSYFISLTQGILNPKKDIVSATINGFGRTCTLLAFAMTTVFITLITLSFLIGQPTLNTILGFTGGGIGATLLMAFITLRNSNKSQLLTEVIKDRPMLGFLLTIAIWVLILSIASLLLSHIHSKQSYLPSLLNGIYHHGWQVHWQIVSTYWWIAFTPITAIFIARYAYGFTLRQILLATLALPALISLLLCAAPYWHWTFSAPFWLPKVAGIIGFILLLSLLCYKKTFSMLTLTYLPARENMKPRSIDLFQQRIKKLCGLIFYLFIPGGVFALGIVMMLFIAPMALVTLLTALTLIPTLRKYSGANLCQLNEIQLQNN